MRVSDQTERSEVRLEQLSVSLFLDVKVATHKHYGKIYTQKPLNCNQNLIQVVTIHSLLCKVRFVY